MPTTEELHAADQRHEAAIAVLKLSLREQGVIIERHDAHLTRLDNLAHEIRESVATKDDIAGMRADLREREALHERLDHYRDRLADMEEQDDDRAAARETRFNRRMNWAVVALFVVEVIVGGLQLLGVHRG